MRIAHHSPFGAGSNVTGVTGAILSDFYMLGYSFWKPLTRFGRPGRTLNTIARVGQLSVCLRVAI